MAVHKVPQDVEADDKFLGPLSFKQFLFFGGAGIGAYLTFLTITNIWPISFIFAIPTLVFGALAFPWSKEQPTELFLASRIRYFIKPRKRIWNQSGVKDLVNITVPVRAVHVYSDGLSQGEVRSRLSALATMVDSRGWAVKNIHSTFAMDQEVSDRLVEAPVATDEKATIVDSAPDVFDDSAGTIARQFDTMIEQSEQERRSATMRLVEEARNKSHQSAQQQQQPQAAQTTAAPVAKKPVQKQVKLPDSGNEQNQDFWFMHQQNQPDDPTLATFQASAVIAPGQAPTPMQVQMADASTSGGLSEQELLETVRKKRERDALQTSSKHERVINPYGTPPPQIDLIQEQKQDITTMTPAPNPDIINLARSNDLSVETLARQANKKKDLGDDEVIISLH